jgi:hypothetical protein
MADIHDAMSAYGEAEKAIDAAKNYGRKIEGRETVGDVAAMLGNVAVAQAVLALAMRIDYVLRDLEGRR